MVNFKRHLSGETAMSRTMFFDLVLGAGLIAAMFVAAAPILA